MTTCDRPSLFRYVKRKCRCDACRAISRQERRRWREDRRVKDGARIECMLCGEHFATTGALSAHETKRHTAGALL